ncbi:MAG: hypothetical protein GX892_05460 [Thermoanaerobacteraceae bacterium]|nr:hypothetical protein [Thermoanaerobacteraceae bacterium]
MKFVPDNYQETKSLDRLNSIIKQFIFSVCTVFLLFVMYSLTTYAWCSDSVINRGNEIASGNFKAVLELSKDNETYIPFSGAIDLEPGESKYYFRVYSIGTLPVNYEVVLNLPEGVIVEDLPEGAVEEEDVISFKNSGLQPNSYDIYEVTFNNDNEEPARIEVEFFTAFNNSSIIKAKSLEDIAASPDYSTIFLMNDIEDNSLLIENPVNINLNGYTLKLDSFIVESDIFFTIDICNGSLSLPENKSIDSTKAPDVILNLNDVDLLFH